MRLFVLTWLYILAAFGLAFIVGYAKISLPARVWLAQERYRRWNRALQSHEWRDSRLVELRRGLVDLFQCPACLGFWIGAIFALTESSALGAAALGVGHLPLVERAFFLGLATSASNFILGALTGLIEVR